MSDKCKLVGSSNEMVRNIIHNTTSVEFVCDSYVRMNYLDPHYASDALFIKNNYPKLKISHIDVKKSSSSSLSSKDCIIL